MLCWEERKRRFGQLSTEATSWALPVTNGTNARFDHNFAGKMESFQSGSLAHQVLKASEVRSRLCRFFMDR